MDDLSKLHLSQEFRIMKARIRKESHFDHTITYRVARDGNPSLVMHRMIHAFDLTWRWSHGASHRPLSGYRETCRGRKPITQSWRIRIHSSISLNVHYLVRPSWGREREVHPAARWSSALSSQYATLKPIRASLLTMTDIADDMQCLASQRTQKLRTLCRAPFA